MSEQVSHPELNLNDLQALRNLIEVVTQRGAFKATELSSVGTLYDKLNMFLDASQRNREKSIEPTQGE